MESKIVTREVVLQLRDLTPEMIANREAEFVISSESTDTYDTVFVAAGADFTRYNTNPIVAYGHRTWSDNPDMILGTSEVRQEGLFTIGKVTFEDAETNPTADKVFRKVQKKTLRMASIGANILEWRYGDETKGESKTTIYFTRWELLEWSIVPIGSNKDALVRSAEVLEEMRTELRNNIEVVDPEFTSQMVKLSVREAQYKFNKKSVK
jgi:HK97 family phage prohead protease